jgi:hypothetical protein
MSDDPPVYITGDVVQFPANVRAEPDRTPHTEEIRARAFTLYATMGARNIRATTRLLTEELAGTGERVPHVSTIAEWAREEQWSEQADSLWRSTKNWQVRQLQTIALGAAMLGQQRRYQVLLGEYEEQMGLALQYLKASELTDRFLRDVLPLSVMQAPPQLNAEDEEATLSTNEKADLARSRLIKRVKGEQVHLTRTKSREERKRELFG